MSDLLQKAFDPESFREQGHLLIDQLADYLTAGGQGAIFPVLPWIDPAEQTEQWPLLSTANSREESFFQRVLQASHHLHHPHYMGHQVAVPAPLSVLAGTLGKLLNNGMAVYEMGPVPSAIEYNLAQWIAPYFGWGKAANGFMTSGGTLANLTALLAARKKQVQPDSWKHGTPQKLAIMVSEQAHYCVDRAVRIMGWGDDGIIKIPTDQQYRMRTELLTERLLTAQNQGIQVIGVVGSACTTATGTYDDLQAIATFCQQHQLWFHVDGAHGACVAFSPKHRQLLAGIEAADSVVLDFHKMLLVPALATGLFFREGSDSYATFSQEAHYLWSQNKDREWHNFAKRTFECTKTMMALQVQVLLETYGVALWQEYVERCYALAQQFAQLLEKRAGWELAVLPDANIVCFRMKAREQAPNELNAWLRQRVLEQGRFYIVQTVLRDALYLRVTLMSPYTEIRHLEALLGELEQHASRYAGNQ